MMHRHYLLEQIILRDIAGLCDRNAISILPFWYIIGSGHTSYVAVETQ